MKVTSKILLASLLGLHGCIDPVNIALPPKNLPLMIDGGVTDDAGPYTVKITQAYSVGGNYGAKNVYGAHVMIKDDLGMIDTLYEYGAGQYKTKSLQGEVGMTYRLIGRTSDGKEFQSSPETMMPAGSVDDIYYNFVVKETVEGIPVRGFDVYINSSSGAGSANRIRWKFTGTYQVETNPGALASNLGGIAVPPPACYSVDPENCTCCTCWISEFDNAPILSNESFAAAGHNNRVFVAFVLVNNVTFQDRYHIEVEQMELSKPVFDFYKGVRAQIENAASLFQPPFFGLQGNIQAVDGKEPVIGIFSASAVARKSIFILKNNVPYYISFQRPIADCRRVAPNSSNVKPPYWP